MAKGWDEKEVFTHALGLPPEERDAYLTKACPDEASRTRIESLLLHQGLGGQRFLVDALAGTPPDLTSPARIGEFRILRRLGEGGMGVVYLAEDTILSRQVAVKVLHPSLTGSEQALARFREEARSAAKLKHPAIVTVFNFGHDGGTHFLVSEFVDGPTLAEEIAERRTGKLDDTTESRWIWHRHAAETIATIADALDCAHRANLVHRDVKPSNILMDRQVGPRLTDFGIAKHLTEEDRTRTATVVGSCHYMSPEQASIAGAHVDQRSDVFSLGVVLYELLALRRPFEGVDTSQVLKAVIECAPPRLRTVDPRIPKDLETICHKAIERDPARRYQTAAHVAADLRCYLVGAPILAQPASVFRRAWRWVGRHRAAAMVLTTLALCGAVAVLGWTLHHRTTESLAWFTVDVTEADCTVLVQHVDARARALGEPVVLGATPIEPQSVPTGAYRVTVVNPDETAFVEFDVLLESPGRGRSTTLRVTENWTEPEKKADPADLGKSGSRVLRGRFLATASIVAGGMGYVPSGEFPYGWSELDDAPTRKRTVVVAACHVDYTETPNRDYKQFCDVTGHPLPPQWKTFGYESVSPDAPLVGVTWEDAEAYARWVGKRLPTMFEWQAAARGKEGRRYPLGDDAIPVDPKVLTLDDLRDFQSPDWRELHDAVRRFAVPVAEGPADVNGFRQFAGNAREFSGSVSSEDDSVVVMGRCWTDSAKDIDLTKVVTAPVSTFSLVHGFRCAKSSIPCRSVGSTTKKGNPNVKLQDHQP